MYKNVKSKEVYSRGAAGISFCLILFITGYLILSDFFSTEEPPEGLTLRFFAGCILIIASVFGASLFLKYMYDYKMKRIRRKNRSRKFHQLRKINEEKI